MAEENINLEGPNKGVENLKKLQIRQTLAGTRLADGTVVPNLTADESAQLAGVNRDGPDEKTAAALARQGKAGIGSEPELTPEERELIVAHNSKRR